MTTKHAYHVYKWIIITILAKLGLSFTPSFATSLPDQVGINAVELAEKIEVENLYTSSDWLEEALQSDTIEPAKRLSHMRMAFSLALRKDSQERLKTRALEYTKYADKIGVPRDQRVGELLNAVANAFDNTNARATFVSTNTAITPFLD